MNQSRLVRDLCDPADLQVLRVLMSPCQQHSSKQVACPHKDSIHSGDVQADFLTGVCPIWFHFHTEGRQDRRYGLFITHLNTNQKRHVNPAEILSYFLFKIVV